MRPERKIRLAAAQQLKQKRRLHVDDAPSQQNGDVSVDRVVATSRHDAHDVRPDAESVHGAAAPAAGLRTARQSAAQTESRSVFERRQGRRPARLPRVRQRLRQRLGRLGAEFGGRGRIQPLHLAEAAAMRRGDQESVAQLHAARSGGTGAGTVVRLRSRFVRHAAAAREGEQTARRHRHAGSQVVAVGKRISRHRQPPDQGGLRADARGRTHLSARHATRSRPRCPLRHRAVLAAARTPTQTGSH